MIFPRLRLVNKVVDFRRSPAGFQALTMPGFCSDYQVKPFVRFAPSIQSILTYLCNHGLKPQPTTTHPTYHTYDATNPRNAWQRENTHAHRPNGRSFISNLQASSSAPPSPYSSPQLRHQHHLLRTNRLPSLSSSSSSRSPRSTLQTCSSPPP